MLRALHPGRAMRGLEQGTREILDRPPLESLSDEALVHELRLLILPETARLRRGIQAESVAAILYFVGDRVFRPYPEARERLATGVTGIPTTWISIGIGELVEAARGVAAAFDGRAPAREVLDRLNATPEGRAWRWKLDRFLGLYGRRGPKEFDIGVPRWSEDPAMVVDLVRAGLGSPPGESVEARIERLRVERGRAIEAAAASAPFWKRRLHRILAGAVRIYMPLREAPNGQPTLDPLFEVEERLETAVEEAGAGEFDGNEISMDQAEGTLYLYGPDADRLLEVAPPSWRPPPSSGARRSRSATARPRTASGRRRFCSRDRGRYSPSWRARRMRCTSPPASVPVQLFVQSAACRRQIPQRARRTLSATVRPRSGSNAR